MKRDTRPPSGTRDFSGDALRRRRRAVEILNRRFELHGFEPLETPAFERIGLLRGLYGEEGETLIFKILKRGVHEASGEADLALRYDLTVPAARAVAEAGLASAGGGFRRYQAGPVWRAERPGRGRFREFWQCDADIYGVPAPAAELETILVLGGALRDLGLADYTLLINSRPLLSAVCDFLELHADDRRAALTALDKLDKAGTETVATELRTFAERAREPEPVRNLAARLGEGFEAELLAAPQVASSEAFAELASLRDTLNALGCLPHPACLNPLLVRGLDYYTGFVFEVTAAGAGTIASGGRYDDLMRAVSGRALGVCGGSLGLERVLMLDEVAARLEPTTARAVHCTLFSEALRLETLQLAERLRACGTAVFVESGGGLKAQLARASAAGRRHCIVFGPSEQEGSYLTLKDLETGLQSRIPLEALESWAEKLDAPD